MKTESYIFNILINTLKSNTANIAYSTLQIKGAMIKGCSTFGTLKLTMLTYMQVLCSHCKEFNIKQCFTIHNWLH